MPRCQSSVDRNAIAPPLLTQESSQQAENSFYAVCPPQFNSERHQDPHPTLGSSLDSYGAPTIGNNSPSSHKSQQTQVPTTHTTSYTHQKHPQPSSQYFGCSQSNASTPWTPAPTTSDVHNRKSRSNSVSSSVSILSSVSQYQPKFAYPEMLSRYLTVNPTESSLAYEDRRAISDGLVQEGEDMFARRSEEQGWRVQGLNRGSVGQSSKEGSDDSRTLGRSGGERDQ